MNDVLLGIDAGSSAVKACAYDLAGAVLGRAIRPLPMAHPRPSRAEMDADAVWREAALAAREAALGLGDRVAAIGVSTACPSVVLMDESSRPLRPAILYLDQRAGGVARRHGERHGAAAHFSAAGNRPGSSTSWLASLAWTRYNEPGVWRRTRRAILMGGYLVLRMTGRAVIDWTQASYSGAFRVAEPESGWDRELLARWEVDGAALPEPGWSCRPAGGLTAEAARTMGVRPGTAVAFGAADTAAAAFALGMRGPGDVFESAGTSGVVTFCLDRPDFDDRFMNRCHVYPGRWLAHGAMSALGGSLEWLLRRVWPELGGPAELERLAAESPPGANGLVFLPYLAGERSPVWDPEASGLWLGLRMDSDRRDLARAVFEGAAFGLRQILEVGVGVWGHRPERLLAVGGGARSRLWAGIKADVLGVDYLCADDPDAAARGAALIGGVAGGLFDGVDDPRLVRMACRGCGASGPDGGEGLFVRPSPARRARYDEIFSVYEKLYPALRNAMHELAASARGCLE